MHKQKIRENAGRKKRLGNAPRRRADKKHQKTLQNPQKKACNRETTCV
jgi:hypothetical protein